MRVFVLCASLLFSTAASSELVAIEGAFATGNSYRSFSKNDQLSYVIGVIDGLKMAPTLGATKKEMKWFAGCTGKMETDQIKAIVDKFLGDNPARWHESMHALVMASLITACPGK